MIKRIRIGIDPGKSGGIAWYYETFGGKDHHEVAKMPDTDAKLRDLFTKIMGVRGEKTNVMCHIEQVHAMPSTAMDRSPEHKNLLFNLQRLKNSTSGNAKSLIGQALDKLVKYQIIVRGVKSTWTFAENYGAIKQCLVDHHIPYNELSPQGWQKLIGITGIKDKPKRKKAFQAKAQALYPDLKATLVVCDAILIMHLSKKIIES